MSGFVSKKRFVIDTRFDFFVELISLLSDKFLFFQNKILDLTIR